MFYNVEDNEKEKCVSIIRFMYNKRDWINILKEKPLNEIM